MIRPRRAAAERCVTRLHDQLARPSKVRRVAALANAPADVPPPTAPAADPPIEVLNTEDPITLDDISPADAGAFLSVDGRKARVYNAASLLRFCTTSAELPHDPVTRRPFTSPECRAIERLAGAEPGRIPFERDAIDRERSAERSAEDRQFATILRFEFAMAQVFEVSMLPFSEAHAANYIHETFTPTIRPIVREIARDGTLLAPVYMVLERLGALAINLPRAGTLMVMSIGVIEREMLAAMDGIDADHDSSDSDDY